MLNFFLQKQQKSLLFKHLTNLSLDFHLNEINRQINSSSPSQSSIQLSTHSIPYTLYATSIPSLIHHLTIFYIPLLLFQSLCSSILFHFPFPPLQSSRNYRLLLNSLRSFSFQPPRIRRCSTTLRSCESSKRMEAVR